MCPFKRSIVYFLVLLASYNVEGTARNLSCTLPPPMVHGSYIGHPKATEVFNEVMVYCDEGYELVGEEDITCTAGNWSNDFPVCLPFCKLEKTNIIQWDDGRCVLPKTVSTTLLGPWLPERSDCGKVKNTMLFVGGGAPVEIQEMPWHAAVYDKNAKPYNRTRLMKLSSLDYGQICGGTLVSTTMVISAAHCFWKVQLLPAHDYAVAVGKEYRPWISMDESGVQKSDVAEIFVPPRYRGSSTNFQDDIALLKLVSAVTFTSYVQPICLDLNTDEDTLLGRVGKVAGWGLTGEDERPSRVLKGVEMPYVPIIQCIEESPLIFWPHITSDKICAGFKNGTAVCCGDSGGGLVFALSDDYRFYLQGIVSAAPTNDHKCNVYTYAVFTFVSKHKDFINKHLS